MVAPYPRIVIFLDSQQGFPTADNLRNGIDPSITIYLVLAFHFLDGTVDAASKWKELGASKQQQYVHDYHSKNIKVMVSVGGGTVTPTTSKWDPAVTANNAAKFAKDNHLDGVDLDWEDPNALIDNPVNALNRMVTYTTTLRNALGNSCVISHSPGAPYLCPTFPYKYPESQFFYYKVDKKVGSLIDFYNVLFYDTNNSDYLTVKTLIDESIPNLPNSALLQIAHNLEHAIPMNKLVIGKPVLHSDTLAGGYMTPDLLAQSVQDAISKTVKDPAGQWKAGIMGWQYHDAKGFHDWADPSAKYLKQ